MFEQKFTERKVPSLRQALEFRLLRLPSLECDVVLCRVVISTCASQPPGLRMCSFHVECIVPIQAILG